MCLSLLDLTVVAVTRRIYVIFGSYNICRFNCKLGPTGKESNAKVLGKNFADPYTILIIIKGSSELRVMKLCKIISKVKMV